MQTKTKRNQSKYLSQGVRHIVISRLNFSAVAVAALKGPEHGGDGEGQQEEPDDDGNLGGFLQHFDEIPPSEMDHAEVAIDGQGDEEGDTGPSVDKQHEEWHLTNHAVRAAPQAVLVIVGLCGKTDHQQEIGNHNVEEEDTFVLPKLESKEEVIQTTFVCFTAINFILHQE